MRQRNGWPRLKTGCKSLSRRPTSRADHVSGQSAARKLLVANSPAPLTVPLGRSPFFTLSSPHAFFWSQAEVEADLKTEAEGAAVEIEAESPIAAAVVVAQTSACERIFAKCDEAGEGKWAVSLLLVEAYCTHTEDFDVQSKEAPEGTTLGDGMKLYAVKTGAVSEDDATMAFKDGKEGYSTQVEKSADPSPEGLAVPAEEKAADAPAAAAEADAAKLQAAAVLQAAASEAVAAP